MSLEEFNLSNAQEALDRALAIASQHTHEYVTLEHLLASLVQEQKVVEVCNDLEVNVKGLTADLETFFASDALSRTLAGRQPRQTFPLKRVVDRAVAQAMFSGRQNVGYLDILISLLQENDPDSHACYFLKKHGMDVTDLKSHVSHGMGDFAEDGDDVAEDEDDDKPIKTKAEKFLEKFCVNLNEEAQKGRIDPLIGRENEVHTLILTTARRTKNNSILVGEPGVGKTAVVEGLAKMIAEDNVPDAIKGSIVYSLNIAALMAGTKFRGDMEERVKQVIDAIEKVGQTKGVLPILFIDEIHTIMGAGSGSQGALDVANLLKPALSKGKLRCIGGTTYEEYRKHFEKDRALLRRFQKLDVNEPSIDDAKRIIAGLASTYEEYHGIKYAPEALDAAVELTARYVTDRMLPDKAIDVIDAAGARQKIRPEDERETNISVKLIEAEVSRIARIPERSVKEDDAAKLERLDSDLRGTVFGQDTAIEAVTDAVYMSRAGLRDPNKPQGSYLFAGPTGVGKTELAKQLAATLDIPLERFDMSEYMEKHSVSKFIGSPPGYVGFGEGGAGSGLLCNAVEKNPHCVLLIDEIEKAHPDIFNVFLQIMDNGQLTNSSGKTINFRNVILIMTTNAGATELQKNSIGFGENSVQGNDDKVIERTFAPEFRNRLDAIVKFNPLAREFMLRIVDKLVAQLNKQAQERNVKITIDDDARNWFAENGYDRLMGARPMARLIQDKLGKPLSRLMLFGGLKNGGSANVTVVNGEVTIVAFPAAPTISVEAETINA